MAVPPRCPLSLRGWRAAIRVRVSADRNNPSAYTLARSEPGQAIPLESKMSDAPKRTMIQYLYLGRMDYDEALRVQAEIVSLRQQGRIENVLLLLEHPPVLTLGRNADRSNVLASGELLARRGVKLYDINRGGDVTYHGPGQLIGYPIFDLRSLRKPGGGRLGPVDFVRLMEDALIRLCAVYGVAAVRICGLTGVWPLPLRAADLWKNFVA